MGNPNLWLTLGSKIFLSDKVSQQKNLFNKLLQNWYHSAINANNGGPFTRLILLFVCFCSGPATDDKHFFYCLFAAS